MKSLIKIASFFLFLALISSCCKEKGICKTLSLVEKNPLGYSEAQEVKFVSYKMYSEKHDTVNAIIHYNISEGEVPCSLLGKMFSTECTTSVEMQFSVVAEDLYDFSEMFYYKKIDTPEFDSQELPNGYYFQTNMGDMSYNNKTYENVYKDSLINQEYSFHKNKVHVAKYYNQTDGLIFYRVYDKETTKLIVYGGLEK